MTPSPDRDRAGLPSRIGNYRIDERLGAGGMGVVYRAFDNALQRPLAIKRVLSDLIDPTRALRFRREARMAARLNHPSIVHIYEIVETDECDWIVMELVEGKTLDRLLRDGLLGLSRTVRLAREIAEGLSEAHGHGIVHRDLKASNVMVNGAGHAKILDFGLAKLYRGDTEPDISAPGILLGTIHAMSPEQAQGLAIDHRSDLFSLGSLLYEMITGTSPFTAATPAETLARICAYEPRPILDIDPAVPRELAELTHSLLNKSPAQRPHNSSEVATALERIEHGGGLQSPGHGGIANAGMSSDITLGARSTLEPPRFASSPTLTSSERRQMTVLCCDVADTGSQGVESSQAFDPETLYELMLQLRPLAQVVAQRHEGTLGNVVGHQLLVYFGYPQAHEDDAERAVRAALDLVSEVSEHRGRGATDGVRPALRVGIHTGPAVVSTSLNSPEPVVLGSTLDLALRHQAVAAPGTVVISKATRSLVKRGFSTEALDPLSPPAGAGEWLVPYRVREMVAVGDEGAVDLAPMVGREQELEQLMSGWAQARAGTGQAVLLSGEPGMGKSRLLRAMRERVIEQSDSGTARWLSMHGSHYTQNTPLHPVVHLLQRTLVSEPGGSTLEQLDALLRRFSLAEALPLFASLLDLPLATRPSMPPERQREETLEALVALLLEMSEREPVILLVEDLHWLDATTLTWLERLIDQTGTVPLLLVMTIRPNTLEIPWGSRARVTQIALGALTSDETERLVLLLSGGQTLGPHVQQHIVAKTDGVPLFVEELTRSVLESADSEEWRELPTTLRDSLAARLARLGAAKEVAQLGSVIGRAFSLKLLAAVSSDSLDSLERELRRLVQSGLVHRRGFGAQTRYAFKHALIRDAAYDSLLKRERQRLHLCVAEALDAGETLEKTGPEILAYHYSEGSRPEKAVPCWLEAARQALGRSAHQEALHHVRAGLAALKAIPTGAERDDWELQLQTTLVPAVIATQGFSSPEVERAYLRGLELCGEQQGRFELLYGLFSFYAVQAKPDRALPLGEQMLRLADSWNSPVYRVQSGYGLGAMSFLLGDFEASRRYLAAASEEGDPDLGHLLARSFGTDDRKTCRIYDALDLWLLGHHDEARERCDAALAWTRETPQPFTLTTVLLLSGILHCFRRDGEAVRRHAEEMIAVAEKHGLFQVRDANVLLGIALATGDDNPDAGIEHLKRSLDAYRATGFRVFLSFYLAELAAACFRQGRFDDSDAALQEAFAALHAGSERFWEPELYRLHGELLARGGNARDAEAAFRKALEVAAARSAASLELRASTSLARLLGAPERDTLAGLCARFAQETPSADRADAEAVLIELV